MKCPTCAEEGEKSTVNIGASFSTLMCTQEFYDEEGGYHYRDPNTRSTWYSCSRGHRWAEETKHECEGCASAATT